MVNMQLVAKINLGVHILHAVWSIVLIGVVAASMLQDGPTSGADKYMFALCWLNIIPLIYLSLSPRFPRTRMFAHPYWVAGVNILMNILWFAAFVAVAAYTNKGISSGESKGKKSGCAAFKDGTGETEKACNLNKDAVGLGVVMWFLWLLTLGAAGYGAWYFSRNRVSPYEDLSAPSHDIQETTKDAFSSAQMHDDYALINKHNGSGPDDDEDLESSAYGHGYGRSESAASHGRSASVASSTYDAGYSSEPYVGAHPGRPLSWAAEREPYAGIGGHPPVLPEVNVGGPPGHGGVLTMPEGPDDYGYHGAGGLR